MIILDELPLRKALKIRVEGLMVEFFKLLRFWAEFLRKLLTKSANSGELRWSWRC